MGAARFRSPPYRSAGCRTENRPAARANRRPACRGPYYEASWGGSAGSSPSQTGHPSGQQHPLVQPKVRAVCLPCPHKPARCRYVPKGETANCLRRGTSIGFGSFRSPLRQIRILTRVRRSSINWCNSEQSTEMVDNSVEKA